MQARIGGDGLNLLTDPLFRVAGEKGIEHLNLPSLLAELGKDTVDYFVGIQGYQHDPFHVFLCYLAGAILARDGAVEPVQGEEYWRVGLLKLAGSAGHEAWQLFSDDYTRPAFMQAPLAGEKRKPSSIMDTPDQLDLLLTVKNHDLKKKRAIATQVDTWIYALINLQTVSSYHGSNNYGISRMNGGSGNRAIVELFRNRDPVNAGVTP